MTQGSVVDENRVVSRGSSFVNDKNEQVLDCRENSVSFAMDFKDEIHVFLVDDFVGSNIGRL